MQGFYERNINCIHSEIVMSSSTNITEWNVTTEKWYTGNIETISKPQIRRVKAVECCSRRGWHDER